MINHESAIMISAIAVISLTMISFPMASGISQSVAAMFAHPAERVAVMQIVNKAIPCSDVDP